MKLPIVLILICSVFIAFFAAFFICFVLAKITSMPSRKKNEIEEMEFAGARYHAQVDNISKHTKLSQMALKMPSSSSNTPEEIDKRAKVNITNIYEANKQ